jgi:putative SOS response-associated peptidase YedK
VGKTVNANLAGADNTVMCGRYTLTTPIPVLAELLACLPPAGLPPRYNIAPTQSVPVVRAQSGRPRECVLMRWGLIPSWQRDRPTGPPLINARSETVAAKPAFRQAFRSRRCLLPADGFFEWAVVEGRKQPRYFHRRDGAPFAFAGLWEHWEAPTGEHILSCAVLTTEANELVRPVHERMPVILEAAQFDHWLEVGGVDLLHPYPAASLCCTLVGTLVNSPRNDSPDCLAPVA